MTDTPPVTTTQAAHLLGLASAASARKVLSRLGVRPVGRHVDTGEKLWSPDTIRTATDARPGRGHRSDLHAKENQP